MFSIKQFLAIICLIAVVASLGTILFNTLISEQDEYKYRAKVEELLREAVKLIEEVRGFSLENLQVEIITVDWARENWGKSFAEADRESIAREERIYKALFMISEDESLYEARVEWWGMIVSAVWQGKIYVVKEYFNPYDKLTAEKTLVHELTHIMQDKYFNIPYVPTFDGDKAKAALIEGDACLMEEAFLNRTKEGFLTMEIIFAPHGYFVKAPSTSETSVYARLPDSVSRLNYFPYEYGLRFVKALYSEGGWQRVNCAYDNFPTTTEQIMHPEKYFINETSIPTEAPTVLGDWQMIRSERFGEYFILVMLERWVSSTEATKVAGGWGGDNFTYYEHGDDYLFTWNITWDSVNDASEFDASFQEMMRRVGAEEMDKDIWKKYERKYSMIRKGVSTIILCSTRDEAVMEMLQLIGGESKE
ncbi:MAG: hypothetical protein QXU42_04035 [Thermoproteota archaeon]